MNSTLKTILDAFDTPDLVEELESRVDFCIGESFLFGSDEKIEGHLVDIFAFVPDSRIAVELADRKYQVDSIKYLADNYDSDELEGALERSGVEIPCRDTMVKRISMQLENSGFDYKRAINIAMDVTEDFGETNYYTKFRTHRGSK